jgi:hypothetical protein
MGNEQVRGQDTRHQTFCQQLCGRLLAMTPRGRHATIELLVPDARALHMYTVDATRPDRLLRHSSALASGSLICSINGRVVATYSRGRLIRGADWPQMSWLPVCPVWPVWSSSAVVPHYRRAVAAA